MFIKADIENKNITIYAFDCAITKLTNEVVSKLNKFYDFYKQTPEWQKH